MKANRKASRKDRARVNKVGGRDKHKDMGKDRTGRVVVRHARAMQAATNWNRAMRLIVRVATVAAARARGVM